MDHEQTHGPWRALKGLKDEGHPGDAVRALGYVIQKRHEVKVQQNTDEWFDARKGCYFTASAAIRTFGGGDYSGGRGPLHYLNVNANYPEQLGFEGSVMTERGHLVEPAVRDAMRGMRAQASDPLATEQWIDLEMHDGGFTYVDVLRTKGPDVALLWTHPETGEPWPMRIGASVDVRVFAKTEAGGPSREVASGEIKAPFHNMYDPNYVQHVHENGEVFATAGQFVRRSQSGFVDRVRVPAKPDYLVQQIIQMIVQGVPASLHVAYYPGDPEHPEQRKGYAVANVLHFSPVLFDLIVTCAARMRYIETTTAPAALSTLLRAKFPYSESKASFDRGAEKAGAPAPAHGGWSVKMAYEGPYAFPVPRSLWERVASEVRGMPLWAVLHGNEQCINIATARRAGLPPDAIAIASIFDSRNNLFLPQCIREEGWPRMTGTYHKHLERLNAEEKKDQLFWQQPGTLTFVPPTARAEDGPWVDELPPVVVADACE